MAKDNELEKELSPIRANEIYPLSVFMQRTGLGKQAMRTARRAGLIVGEIGNRKYVKGADFLKWYDQQAALAC